MALVAPDLQEVRVDDVWSLLALNSSTPIFIAPFSSQRNVDELPISIWAAGRLFHVLGSIGPLSLEAARRLRSRNTGRNKGKGNGLSQKRGSGPRE